MSNETDRAVAADEGATGPDGMSTSSSEEVVTSEPTSEQIEDWKEKAAKAQEHWERLLRVSADFDNFKKRAARERQEGITYANASLLEKIVPILDNLDMALTAASGAQANTADALITGVGMIQSQLRTVLAGAGLEEIDAAGKPFDPNFHEAVSQLPSADVPEGTVLQQIRKGYKLKDRLIRPASVVVAKKAST